MTAIIRLCLLPEGHCGLNPGRVAGGHRAEAAAANGDAAPGGQGRATRLGGRQAGNPALPHHKSVAAQLAAPRKCTRATIRDGLRTAFPRGPSTELCGM